ncbi:hypothetical protein [Corynebacterium glyciniphilum]|uniref:hypothetical protein n=1 Tax=Corynebacterium glyciniphilum TaxID=1404244 RepID=UPI003FD59640
MPYTVHTLDGQAHTYPGPRYVHVNDAGLLSVHRDVPQDRYGNPSEGPVVAAYPAGQWTHYHAEPAPYETDDDTKDEAIIANAEAQANAVAQPHEGMDKWQAEFQRHLDAGRKAARAQ